jgi:hypothetical protein
MEFMRFMTMSAKTYILECCEGPAIVIGMDQDTTAI